MATDIESPFSPTSPDPDPSIPNPIPTTPTTFPLFPLLPPELRLKIFTLASSPPLNPIIHILTPSSQYSTPHPKFISNQPPHPLLHTTHLSRHTYIRSASLTPAFNTYVSFAHDLFYFTNFGLIDDLTFSRLRAFLAYEEARFIKRLAVRTVLFDRAGLMILEGMETLQEFYVVWGDWRGVRETCMERGVRFKDVEEGELMGKERSRGMERLRGGIHSEFLGWWFYLFILFLSALWRIKFYSTFWGF
ncbi:hypothetical protein BKA65DRAFT_497757 [Rhexocercosporidium sp. MPI-PUGE-AT-0058]|nr:hypothetical protein BKA65DRAFT_497757 [Rhexocercosporidium sp. MPI-PUGE-AT-0058]